MSSMRIILPGGQDLKALLSLPSSILVPDEYERFCLMDWVYSPSSCGVDHVDVELESACNGSSWSWVSGDAIFTIGSLTQSGLPGTWSSV